MLAQIVAEGSRVRAQYTEHQVGASDAVATPVAELGSDARQKAQVAQHAKQREKRERNQSPRFVARNPADQVEHLWRLDPIELRAKLQRAERVENGITSHLALHQREHG